ncbi:unnamed protein product [Angiostrongylus costaricensis]|uniref:Uncharacterized protein n=1 Tax=Angiostrongylus costaricensis TaxID=334426 RepID=A0A3P7HA12_ANGCS|nr:unnamed protein product [Angiostrongylus costaricensis]
MVCENSQLSFKANNVCVWLNGAAESERPIWTTLWNISRRRYCTDGGANRVVDRINLQTPDVVIGDMDSILPAVEDSLKLTTLLIHAPDQDKTDLTKCLEGSRVVLLGGTSGRFDHALAAINSMYHATTLMDEEGEHCIEIERHLVTGTCGVIPFCQKTTAVTMSGFRWNLGL